MSHLLISISWNVPLLLHTSLVLGQKYGRDELAKDTWMSPLMLILLALAIFVCAFGYMIYHHEAERRARVTGEKKRNLYHDRI